MHCMKDMRFKRKTIKLVNSQAKQIWFPHHSPELSRHLVTYENDLRGKIYFR